MKHNHKKIILLSLMMAALWCSLLYATDYPPESWAGVAAVAYSTLYGVQFVVSRANAFAIRKTYDYLVATFGKPDPNASLTHSQRLTADIISTAFMVAVGYITGGLTIILTSLVIQAVGLPAIGSRVLETNLILAGASVSFIVAFHAGIHVAIYKARRKKEQYIQPVALARQYLHNGLRKIEKLFSVIPIPLEPRAV